MITCPECKGTGKIFLQSEKPKDINGSNKSNINNSSKKCLACNGTSKIKCPGCLGAGIVDMTAMA